MAATDDATVYDVAHDRDFDAATNLVPADYAGTVVRDGWVVYNSYKEATHQTCIAHYARRPVMRSGTAEATVPARSRPDRALTRFT